MFCRMRRWRKEILALVDMRFCVFNALCKRFGACLVGDDRPNPAARVHNSGDDSKGDNEGGKDDGGRGYEDDGNDGDDGDDDGSNGDDDDAKWRQTQQSNIKPTSTARNVVVTTARATMKAARATVAGSNTRTMATMVTTATKAAMAATMTPNGDKDNDDGICRHQQRRDILCRSKSAGKCDRQLISRGDTSRTSFPLCWGGCRPHKPSRYRERRRA
jgi:hypothetical protein